MYKFQSEWEQLLSQHSSELSVAVKTINSEKIERVHSFSIRCNSSAHDQIIEVYANVLSTKSTSNNIPPSDRIVQILFDNSIIYEEEPDIVKMDSETGYYVIKVAIHASTIHALNYNYPVETTSVKRMLECCHGYFFFHLKNHYWRYWVCSDKSQVQILYHPFSKLIQISMISTCYEKLSSLQLHQRDKYEMSMCLYNTSGSSIKIALSSPPVTPSNVTETDECLILDYFIPSVYSLIKKHSIPKHTSVQISILQNHTLYVKINVNMSVLNCNLGTVFDEQEASKTIRRFWPRGHGI